MLPLDAFIIIHFDTPDSVFNCLMYLRQKLIRGGGKGVEWRINVDYNNYSSLKINKKYLHTLFVSTFLFSAILIQVCTDLRNHQAGPIVANWIVL